ncbi:hypothetical protein PHYPSEUDO_001441 [Phytophthora pseudosyringae]|uniref:Uncharacterized protein n=1 Tax=Phytophthora pseudosyringae TaxID=221518 RepID=A0A8T1VW92_9STRA|nr:hypothetical protein PHYPSEUDO_001441 [Phytophthora pseudosyringae]
MQRRTRSRAAGRAPVAPLPTFSAHFKQTQTRAAALTNGKRDFRQIYGDVEGPGHDNNVRVKDPTASYSDDLMNAFKRKTQELCDETREQYEQKLERQEAQHERQAQSLQRQLREVLGSSVSLAEHEQIVATIAKEQQRELEEIRMRHRSELRELEPRCEHKWQAKLATVSKEKAALMHRMEQLELLRSKAEAEAKLTELRWAEQLEAACRSKEAAEKRVGDTKKRLADACRIIAALKTRVRHHARDLESQRDLTTEMRDEVMKCKLAHAGLKGDVASLERGLDHAQRAVADEKTNSCALQNEITGLREHFQRQECSAVELTASAEHHAIERKQLQKEVESLRESLQAEKQTVKDATARLDKMQQRATEAQLQHRDLRTRLELQQTTETSLKRQKQRLRQRVEQFKAVVEKLLAENKQLGEDATNRDASTEAWAKKLFGRRQ